MRQAAGLVASMVLLAVLAPGPQLHAAPDADESPRRARIAAAARATDSDALVRTLRDDPDPLVRAAAATGLGRLRAAPAALPLAAALEGDPEGAVRAEAARALANLARRADPGLFARSALEYVPEDAHIVRDRRLPPEAVAVLARAVADPAPLVRVEAARALGDLGPDAAGAAGALAARLADDDESLVRALAARALGRAGAAGAADALARALGDRAQAVRLAAAKALGRVDGRPPHAARALLEAAGDRDPAVRAAAIESLVARPAEADPPGLAAGLAAALDDPADAVRAAAADALLARVPAGGNAPLARRLDIDRRLAREPAPAARAALAALAAALRPEAAAPHLDAVVAALDDRSSRRAAERALVRLARAGLPALDALRGRLASGDLAAGPGSPTARALARVEAGGPLVLPDGKP